MTLATIVFGTKYASISNQDKVKMKKYNNKTESVLRKRVLGTFLAFAVLSILPQLSLAGIIPGTPGNLVFDFIDGNFDGTTNLAPNEVSFPPSDAVRVFGVDGMGNDDTDSYGVGPLSDLPDFPDYRTLLPVNFRTGIEFTFEPTDFVASGFPPDSFSFFIFDDLGTSSLFNTTGPGNALFTYEIDEFGGTLTVYLPLDPNTDWTVDPTGDGGFDVLIQTGIASTDPPVIPEPSSMVLWSLIAVGICGYARRSMK